MARTSTTSKTQFNLFLFGTFRLQARAGAANRTIHLPRRKVETLLAYLALNPVVHSREKLAALFWGDTSDEQARTSLRTALATLRKTLGENAIVADHTSVQIDSSVPLWVDVYEFTQALTTAPEHAIELYGGDLLSDCYDDWVTPQREHLRAQYIETLLRLTQQMRSQSEYERAIAYARKILATDPANETAHQHVMFCEMARGNRAAAIEQYAACQSTLHDELNVEPSPETQGLYHWLKQTQSLAPSTAARITNLPIPISSFIGRKSELGRIKSLLLGSRLLTLTGAGGSGKTRLATQTAMELIDQFRDGVWWVELASVTNPALVPQSIAKALGVNEQPQRNLTDTLADALSEKQCLLVIDNCEHLIAACAEIADTLLRHARNLKIMATSREPLNIIGETVFHVPSLTIPSEAATREELLMGYESVRLFVERAHAVKPDFAIDSENASAIIQICRRLDGIPLALELAAARVVSMSPQEIAAHLDDRFNLLTGGSRTALPRQQTLRALIDWSFDLLSPGERKLFCRLGVFYSGRTLNAIQAVCAGDDVPQEHMLDLVTQLVTKSLLSTETGEEGTRYRFLETIRHYAREKLAQSGEAEQTRERHLDYFARWAETIVPHSPQAYDRIERERHNLRAALEFAMTHQRMADALCVCLALVEFLDMRGYWTEARQWLERVTAQAQTWRESDVPTGQRMLYAWAEERAAELAWKQSDDTAARALAQSSLAHFRELNDWRGMAWSLNALGDIARDRNEIDTALVRYEEGLALARVNDDDRLTATLFNSLASVSRLRGEIAHARDLYDQSLALRRNLGDKAGMAAALNGLGILIQNQGDYAGARAIFESSLQYAREAGDKRAASNALGNLASGANRMRDYARSLSLYEENLKIARELGDARRIATTINNLASLYANQDRIDKAQELYEESLRLARQVGDRRGEGITLSNLANIFHSKQDYVNEQAMLEQSLAIARESGDRRSEAIALLDLGISTIDRGEDVTAQSILATVLQLMRSLNDRPGVASALALASVVALRHGDLETARLNTTESIALRRELNAPHDLPENIVALAGIACARQDYERAAQLCGAVDGLLKTHKTKLITASIKLHQANQATARTQLGESHWHELEATGRGLTLEQALGLGQA